MKAVRTIPQSEFYRRGSDAQLDLLTAQLPEQPAPIIVLDRPWKEVRKVSRAVYAFLRDGDRLAFMEHRVLTALAYYRNRTQTWPTAAELARFMYNTRDGKTNRRRIARDDARLVAPRLTFLVKGEIVKDPETGRTLIGPNGRALRRGGGVCQYLPKRICTVTGTTAAPVAIREVGSPAVEEVRGPEAVH